MATFSYSEIEAGFSGLFDYGTVNLRKFQKEAILYLRITGTAASLNASGLGGDGNAIFVVTTDGTTTTPLVSGGAIELFSGLSDTAHDVAVIVAAAYAGNNNWVDMTDNAILDVTGASPAVDPIYFEFTTDPNFPGRNSISDTDPYGGDVLPNWRRPKSADSITPELSFNAQCDEIKLFSEYNRFWYAVDGGTPTLVTTPESTSGKFATLATGLDNTQVHRYTIWTTTNPNVNIASIAGVVALNSGSKATMSDSEKEFYAIQIGDSITSAQSINASIGRGYVDTFRYGLGLNWTVSAAGISGYTVEQIRDWVVSVINSKGTLPDCVVWTGGRNNTGQDFTAALRTTVDNILGTGVQKVILHGMINDNASDVWTTENAIIEAVANEYGSKVVYVDASTWDDITKLDGVHPNATGYENLADRRILAFNGLFAGNTSTGIRARFIDEANNQILPTPYGLEYNGTLYPPSKLGRFIT